MYILAIETTGPVGSVAVVDEKGKIVGEEACSGQMSHLKDLIPMTARLLGSTGIRKEDLSVIATSIGPGSFTGIRIGVSTGRALCQALASADGLSVPTLESFLYCDGPLREKEKAQDSDNIVICPIINARRGQVYGMVEGFLEAGPYMLADILEVIKREVFPQGKKVVFMGDGIDAYEDIICAELDEAVAAKGENSFYLMPKELRYQDAKGVGRLAAQMLSSGAKPQGFAELLPDYMRKAEAEQKLESGQLPICKGPKQE